MRKIICATFKPRFVLFLEIRVLHGNVNISKDVILGCLRRQTPLHSASANGSFQACQFLVASNASIHSRDKLYDALPLLTPFSLKFHWIAPLSRLIFNDLFTSFCSEQTPLHFASERGHVDICQFLVASKAGVDSKNHKCDASVIDTTFVFECFLLKMHFGNVFPIAWCIVVFQKSDPPPKSYRKQQNRCCCVSSQRLSARVSSTLTHTYRIVGSFVSLRKMWEMDNLRSNSQ